MHNHVVAEDVRRVKRFVLGEEAYEDVSDSDYESVEDEQQNPALSEEPRRRSEEPELSQRQLKEKHPLDCPVELLDVEQHRLLLLSADINNQRN